MAEEKPNKDQKGTQLNNKASGHAQGGRNTPGQPEIEQIRVEHRREADLEDKTPAGDAGVEDNPGEMSGDEKDEKIY